MEPGNSLLKSRHLLVSATHCKAEGVNSRLLAADVPVMPVLALGPYLVIGAWHLLHHTHEKAKHVAHAGSFQRLDSNSVNADLQLRSRLVRHRSEVREVLGSNPRPQRTPPEACCAGRHNRLCTTASAHIARWDMPTCSSQLDTPVVPRASRSQLENCYAHVKGIARPFHARAHYLLCGGTTNTPRRDKYSDGLQSRRFRRLALRPLGICSCGERGCLLPSLVNTLVLQQQVLQTQSRATSSNFVVRFSRPARNSVAAGVPQCSCGQRSTCCSRQILDLASSQGTWQLQRPRYHCLHVILDGNAGVSEKELTRVIKNADTAADIYLFVNVTRCGATVAERLAYSPPTKAKRVHSPAGTPDFSMWESCRTMRLVGRFSRGSPVSPTLSLRCCSILTSITLIRSQDLWLRAAQISSLTHVTRCIETLEQTQSLIYAVMHRRCEATLGLDLAARRLGLFE
ncbi:hypothetical protein PR048_014499 [Dryococelus australis]|uniref:Uncharacterized protein n=1 Tax=Dryococelus australis TaxID=614101 RepID=A0ABQ9HEE1_9NEOP|nr:hypothetical protein PR048_014499 [Dryococelus australis]